ncbi:YD repeat-containing protein [Flavobacterium branchiophilum]|uniref:YD repeat-containing protein n=1 Tax=Flavobacterium branchiophilum TaxID=55197 RepID=A0A543G0E3_9FLAO|nr:YD repeat-containing protein [Flavobacterium branchiophilum]
MSYNLFAQRDFNRSIISKNSILKCSEYSVIPKTNPDYYKKPIGLMLKAEFFFDINGNVIKYFSPDGAEASHSKSKDLIENYLYKDNRIVKMSRVGFDSISVEYLYFDKKNLICKIMTNHRGERIGLEMIRKDNKGKEVRNTEVNFNYTSQLNSYIDLNNYKILYYKNRKKINNFRKVIAITIEELNLFKTSTNIELIERKLTEIEKNKFISELNFNTLFIYNNQKQLTKEISKESTIKYFYNKKGLLISRIDKNKDYIFKSKYIYSKEISN